MTISFVRAIRTGGMLALLGAGAGCTRSTTAPPDMNGITLNVIAGNTQSGPVNMRLPNAIRVQVLNNQHQPVPNFLLDFVVTSGGGSVFGGAELTNAEGYADEQWTLGPRLGSQTLQAREVNSYSGVAASYGDFTAIGTPPSNVLVVAATGPTGLAVMNADGSGLKSIDIGGLAAGHPVLSPNHLQVLFDNGTPFPQGGIYEVNVDGSGLSQTFQNQVEGNGSTLFTFTDPMWNPDGIQYVVDFIDDTGPGLISNIINFPVGEANCMGAPTQGSFSPGGAYLMVMVPGFGAVNCTPNETAIFTQTINGLVQLTSGGTDPAWSPDGKHIALTYNGHTAVMDPDGTNIKPTTGSFGLVSWSPDSQLWAADSGYVNTDGTNYVKVKGCPCRFAWQ